MHVYVMFNCMCTGPEGCEKLRNPDNGYVITKGRKVGSYAKYVCDMKHYLVGNKFRKCLETGWTGEDPVCKRTLVMILPCLITHTVLYNYETFLILCNTA